MSPEVKFHSDKQEICEEKIYVLSNNPNYLHTITLYAWYFLENMYLLTYLRVLVQWKTTLDESLHQFL